MNTITTIILIILKELRLEKGLQQSYLATKLGITPSAYTKIELGHTPHDNGTIWRYLFSSGNQSKLRYGYSGQLL